MSTDAFFKRYLLPEQLDRLRTYETPPGVWNLLEGCITALRGKRLPEKDRLGIFVVKHVAGIAAHCRLPPSIRSGMALSNR